MKVLAFLIVVLLLPVLAVAQQAQPESYRCLPCGGDCDNTVLPAAGKCAHCGMSLVPVSTITFREVAPASVCDYISRHPEAVLLDVRSREEFEGKATPDLGTLRGAINIPLPELSRRSAELERYKGREILVFCSHSHRSPQAAYVLTQAGFASVFNLAGGMSQVADPACKR